MVTRKITTQLAYGCMLALLLDGFSIAEDWPGWRGPQRDGHLVGFAAPKTWPKELRQLWKVEIGEGHSSPLVEGDLVFAFSRQKDREVVRALKLDGGQEVWNQSYPAVYSPNGYAASHGKGPKSTPILAGGRLFTLGISGILSAWDAKSGKLLWQNEYSKTYKVTSPLYGTAMSPAVEEGLLVAHVGGHGQGALAALDVETGKPKWQWTGDGPGYASPVIVTLGGTRQVITQSQNRLIGAAVADGKLLWSLPFETSYTQNIVTPVVAGDLVVFSGISKGTIAYRFEKQGGAWSAKQVWHNDDVSMYMSSPVVVGECLFGLTNRKRGQFFCLDLKSGKTLWTSDGRMGDNAALVATDAVILALTSGSDLIALRPSPEKFEVFARYQVADTPTWAHPVVLSRRLLVKDRASLILWTLGE
jgi:outer membrane protein assembly factor BamB